MNPKIGKLTPGEYPTQMITGKPYARSEYDPPPLIVHDLIGDYVAIGDTFAPAGFDIEAELAALKAELTPTPTAPKKAEAVKGES